MKMTTHRALSLAIASLGDSSRTLDTMGGSQTFAAEIREARDHLTALRDNPNPAIGLPNPMPNQKCSSPHES